MIGIRGAIRVDGNRREDIYRETQRLLREMLERNGIGREEVVSAFFTMTPDLNADFPAYAARELGWAEVPMLGAQETAVPGALDRVVRVLLHVRAEPPARHVYLGEAAAMRPDLAEEGDAVAWAAEPRAEPPRFGALLVVGLGLIGGSVALAVRQRGLFRTVLGHDRSPEALDLARRAGAVAEAVPDLEEVLPRADVILLAIPIGELLDWLGRWGAQLPEGSVLIDVGSTKWDVVEAMDRLPEDVEAVGAHPMAGSTDSGMEAARPDLFHGSWWALVESRRTRDRARNVASAVVEAVGGRPFWTDAEVHDRATAVTSHLPYIVSSALALHAADRAGEEPILELLGPGIRDMTRIAASDSGVMAGILATNWPRVRREVLRFRDRLGDLVERLDAGVSASGARERGAPGGTEEELVDELERIRRARESLMDPDAGREDETG